MTHFRSAIAALALLAASSAGAQQQIPLRSLSPVLSTDSGVIRAVSNVRSLPDGRVLINDRIGRKLLMFDSTLKKVTIIADTAIGAANGYGAGNQTPSLIPYFGDSTLFVDYASQAFIVIDGNGKFGRVMSAPKVADLSYMAANGSGFDSKGRLIYRGFRRAAPASGAAREMEMMSSASNAIRIVPGGPDSAPLLRIDWDTRQVDTIGMFKIPTNKMAQQTVQGSCAGCFSMRSSAVFNPLPQTDEWALLPDGTVAIVRGQDYHVDWIGVDDSRKSSAKMPFAWKRISLEEKQQIIDSIKAARAAAQAKAPPTPPPPSPSGVVFAPMPLQIVEPAELPDYYPAVRAGQVKADLEGNLWVLPATGLAVTTSSGLVFDIVNRNGEVFERVQLPPGRNLVGFGHGGVIYMSPPPLIGPTGPTTGVLERAVVIRPAGATIKP